VPGRAGSANGGWGADRRWGVLGRAWAASGWAGAGGSGRFWLTGLGLGPPTAGGERIVGGVRWGGRGRHRAVDAAE
jgi:hypothetical protein